MSATDLFTEVAQLDVAFDSDVAEMLPQDTDLNAISLVYANNTLERFLDKNPKLQNVISVGIHSGYTSRLLEGKYSKLRRSIVNPDVVFPDNVWSSGTTKPYFKDAELGVILQQMPKELTDGVVCFRETDVKNIFSYIDRVAKGDFCACCNIFNVMDIKWYTSKFGLVTILDVDTESG